MRQDFSVSGAGGGGGGKKGGSGGKEAKNTLQSNARARIAELISEGPIESIETWYFDQTPIVSPDGEQNFEGLTWEWRAGTPDQAHVPGLPMVETPYSVEAEASKAIGPVTRTIVETNADAVKVIVRIPALVKYDDKGGIKGTDVAYHFELKSAGGQYQTVVTKNLHNQKTTSAWQVQHEIRLTGTGPWDLRMVRDTEDSDDSKKQNQTFWESYTVVTEGKFTYPNSAYVFFEVDAEKFGSSIPARAYKVRGLKVQVPTNYNPVTRAYTGAWDGNFKIAWTNNPAWVFYDLVTNDRYGLGEYVDSARVDKWALYLIGKYCDELIPSGFKRDNGQDILEPRFTYNGVINTRTDAFNVLKNVTNAFRGMSFWALGQVFAVSDMPVDAMFQVTPANVIDGKFTYSGTSRKARHSVAIVSFNDQNDFGRPAVEVVISPEMLQRYGWRETTITKHGCTSRGEAVRFGRWILDTEENETETVEYTAGWDHAELKPFDIVAIADPNKALLRMGGRVEAINTARNIVTLDAPIPADKSVTNYLQLTMPTGALEKLPIIAYSADNRSVTVSQPFSAVPVEGALYIVSSVSLNPRPFRVITIKETDEGFFQVQALEHDVNKYARVERGLALDPIQYTRPPTTTAAPLNLNAVESQYVENGVAISKILLSWTPGEALAARHIVSVDGPNGTEVFTNLSSPSIEIFGVVPGTYSFDVRSFGLSGIPSRPAVLEYEAHGWGGVAMPRITNLRTPTGSNIIETSDFEILWDNDLAGGIAFYQDNIVEVYDAATGAMLRSEVVTSPRYVYTFERNKIDTEARGSSPARSLRFDVVLRDNLGRTSPDVTLSVSNPVPVTPTPELKAGFGQIHIDWPFLAATDYVGTLVWISTDPSFNPLTTTPTYDTVSGPISYPVQSYVPHFVVIASYDTFGKTGLNLSPMGQVTPLQSGVDIDPPARPTGLKYVSVLNLDGTASINFSWDANTEKDLGGYQLELLEVFSNGSKSNWYPQPTDDKTTFEFKTLPGKNFEARLRAFDQNLNFSFYHATIPVAAIKDTAAPARPTTLETSASFRAIFVKWSPNTEPDFHHYEVFVGTSSATPPTGDFVDIQAGLQTNQAIAITNANQFAITGLRSGDVRWVFLRAVDESGNASAWSDGKQQATASEADVDLSQYDIAVIMDELPDPITATTPRSVFSRATLKTYVQTLVDGEIVWVEETSATRITGQLNEDQIGDLAISAAKIQAAAVTRDALDFAAVGSTEIDNGAISTPKIRTDAIDARKIRADAVEAYHLSADSVTARAMDADSVTARAIKAGEVKTVHLEAEIITADKIAAEQINVSHLIGKKITAEWLSTTSLITVRAQIANAVIDDAHIVNISAAKIMANTVLSNEVLVSGQTLGSIATSAADPAKAINLATTKILPGLVQISQGVSLSDWRYGNGSTINGDQIEAGTISANKVSIGVRGVTVEGIEFEHNSPSTNRVSWTAGTITFMDNAGTVQQRQISAGSATWTTGALYLFYYNDGRLTLNADTSKSWIADPNVVIFAVYRGGTDLVTDYGRTIIEGSKIKTGTITAQQISVTSISAAILTALSIKASMVDTADLIANSALIENLVANTAKMNSLRAGVIAGRVISAGNLIVGADYGSVIASGGTYLSTIAANAATGAQDPAARITSISGDKVRTGMILAANNRMQIDLNNARQDIYDEAGTLRVRLGLL